MPERVWNVKVCVGGPTGHAVLKTVHVVGTEEYQTLLAETKKFRTDTGIWFYLET